MVDYSRFEHIDVSDDESERQRPQVTRLDAGSRVVIGPSGAHVAAAKPPAKPAEATARIRSGTVDYARWDALAADVSSDEDGGGTDSDDDDPEAVAAAAAALARPAPRPPPPSAPPATPAAAAAAPTPPSLSRNGSVVGCSYCWSQAADEATLSVFCPPGTRAKDVSVRLVDAAESFSVSRPLLPPHAHLPPRLLVSLRGAPLFDHQLAYAVERPTPGGGGGEGGGGGGDEGGGDDDASRARAAAAAAAEPPDWEIVDDEPAEAAAGGRPPKGRCVRVFLRKRSPAAGVVVWWARFAAGEPAIDTASISDRARGAARAGAARAAWAEAEAAFKAKVAAHKAGPEDDRLPVEVDADDD